MRRVTLLALAAIGACHGNDGDLAASRCGDGIATGSEGCDGADLRGRRCADLGFAGGTLACHPACVLDVRGCAATATGDAGTADAAPPPVAFDSAGHARIEGSLASAAARDVFAVSVPAGRSGNLRVWLPTGNRPCPELSIEVHAPAWTVAASPPPAFDPPDCLEVDARGLPAGVTTVRVGARKVGAPLAYALEAQLDLEPCGDGVVDDGQECDDGNSRAGDGCAADCTLEPKAAREPDDQIVAAAGPFVPPFVLAGAADRTPVDDDWVAFQLDRRSILEIRMAGVDAPACAELELDTFDGEAPALVAFRADDPGGCQALRTEPPGVGPGTLYLRLRTRAGTAYRALVRVVSVCGNGIVEPPEDCDGSPGCDECHFGAVCGDGALAPPESCDDGNLEAGDCCDALCEIEPGCEREPNDFPGSGAGGQAPTLLRGELEERPPFAPPDTDFFTIYVDAPSADVVISSGPACSAPPGTRVAFHGDLGDVQEAIAGDDGCFSFGYTTRFLGVYDVEISGGVGPYAIAVGLASVCGDGEVSGTETCDDGSSCVARGCDHAAVCGDGTMTRPETCDDGNLAGDDACPADCGVVPACGDGHLDPGEACDDGNLDAGDGCAPDCQLEPAPACGDGRLDPGEACDDGNLAAGDGCDGACLVEPGHLFESEPNDDGTPAVADDDFRLAAAERLPASDVVVHAALDPAGDEDGFAVVNPTAGELRVVAATHAPARDGCDGHLVLRARDALGVIFAVADGPGGCARLDLRLSSGATLYLQVSDASDNSLVPAYLLDVSYP